jgi:DNA-binding CsgD family transcriptional regulator
VKGYTSAAISEELILAPTTVDVYIARMKQKLGCSSKRELIIKAQELGLVEYFVI